MKNFIQKISNEKSDVWVKILKTTAIIGCIIFLFLAICFFIVFLSNPWYEDIALVAFLVLTLVGIGTFVLNMVVVNALYNLQEIRKAVTKSENEYDTSKAK